MVEISERPKVGVSTTHFSAAAREEKEDKALGFTVEPGVDVGEGKKEKVKVGAEYSQLGMSEAEMDELFRDERKDTGTSY